MYSQDPYEKEYMYTVWDVPYGKIKRVIAEIKNRFGKNVKVKSTYSKYVGEKLVIIKSKSEKILEAVDTEQNDIMYEY